MSRTHKRVRLNRGGLTGQWSAVRVNQLGVITDKWPLHPDDAALLDQWQAAAAERDELAARLAAVEALADEWERTEAYACHNAGDCTRCVTYQGAVIRLRAALAAPTDTTKEN